MTPDSFPPGRPVRRETEREGGDPAAQMNALLGTLQDRTAALLEALQPDDRGYDQALALQSALREGLKRLAALQAPPHRPAGPRTEPAALPGFGGGGESILLVDDEQAIIDVTRDMLEMMGYRVVTATTGQKAMQTLEDEGDRIDLVLLDMVLPDMDGDAVFDRLRAIRPRLRVLLASGFGPNAQMRGLLARGCRGFLQKPFGMTELSRKIREALATEP